MTRIPTGDQFDPRRSRFQASPTPIARPGTVGLEAPGLQPTVAGSQTARQFAQLAEALGSTAALTRRLGAEARSERDRVAKEAEIAQQGIVRAAFNRDRDQLQKVVLEDGALDDLIGADNRAELIDEFLVGRYGGDALSAVQREFIQNNLTPQVLSGLDDRRKFLEAQAKANDIEAYRSELYASPDKIGGAFEELQRNHGMTREEFNRSVLLPTLKDAADLGNGETVAAIAGALGDAYLPAQEAARNKALAAIDAQEASDRAAYIDGLYGVARTSGPLAAIDAIDPAIIGEEKATQLRERFTRDAQEEYRASINARVDTLGDPFSNGYADRLDSLLVDLARGVQYAPDDPRHIPLSTAQSIRDRYIQRTEASLSEQRVAALFAGSDVLLTPGEDARAVDGMFATLGVITPDGRIANPQTLASAVNRVGFLTERTRQVAYAMMESDVASDRETAAAFVSEVQALDNGLFSALYDGASDRVKRGMMTALSGGSSASAITQAMNDVTTEQNQREYVDFIRTQVDGYDPAKIATDVLRKASGNQAWNPWSPTFQPSRDIVRAVQNQIVKVGQAGAHLGPKELAEASKKAMESYVAANYDFVDWNGDRRAVPITSDEGLSLPPGMRWQPQYRKEIEAEMRDAGIDPKSVSAIVPYLDPVVPDGGNPGDYIGWAALDADGNLMESFGIWKPSVEQRESAEMVLNRAQARILRKSRGQQFMEGRINAPRDIQEAASDEELVRTLGFDEVLQRIAGNN